MDQQIVNSIVNALIDSQMMQTLKVRKLDKFLSIESSLKKLIPNKNIEQSISDIMVNIYKEYYYVQSKNSNIIYVDTPRVQPIDNKNKYEIYMIIITNCFNLYFHKILEFLLQTNNINYKKGDNDQKIEILLGNLLEKNLRQKIGVKIGSNKSINEIANLYKGLPYDPKITEQYQLLAFDKYIPYGKNNYKTFIDSNNLHFYKDNTKGIVTYLQYYPTDSILKLLDYTQRNKIKQTFNVQSYENWITNFFNNFNIFLNDLITGVTELKFINDVKTGGNYNAYNYNKCKFINYK